MASRDHKIVRRAQALAELDRLSKALAQRFGIAAPGSLTAARDAELAEIQRFEGVNGMLARLLEAGELATEKPEKSKKSVKHGPDK